MLRSAPDIIAKLKRELLPLQRYKAINNSCNTAIDLGDINYSFPNNEFPLAAIHEFTCETREASTASSGFIAGILSALMKNKGTCIWISPTQKIFPLALVSFGINPERIIFINISKQKELLWVMEEALKCEGLAAVVGEIKELSFTESRRLQLAIEQSKVTGFVLRCNPHNLMTTACVTRWKITSLASELPGDMPGVGFPKWRIELLKVRNGKPGKWEIEWVNGGFNAIHSNATIVETLQRKTG